MTYFKGMDYNWPGDTDSDSSAAHLVTGEKGTFFQCLQIETWLVTLPGYNDVSSPMVVDQCRNAFNFTAPNILQYRMSRLLINPHSPVVYNDDCSINYIDGRFETKMYGTWGSVCDSEVIWRDQNSKVKCRALNLPYSNANRIIDDYQFEIAPVTVANLRCQGNEAFLSYCKYAS